MPSAWISVWTTREEAERKKRRILRNILGFIVIAVVIPIYTSRDVCERVDIKVVITPFIMAKNQSTRQSLGHDYFPKLELKILPNPAN